MIYTCTYKSELGNILLAADEIGLTGLWFEGQKSLAPFQLHRFEFRTRKFPSIKFRGSIPPQAPELSHSFSSLYLIIVFPASSC